MLNENDVDGDAFASGKTQAWQQPEDVSGIAPWDVT